MSEQIYFFKGKEANLPKTNIQIGGLYYCTDTGNTYIGTQTNKMQLYSTATGKSTTSHGETFNDYVNNKTTSEYGHAEGYSTTAGKYSHSEGYRTGAKGESCHTEGHGVTAVTTCAHAEGFLTSASDRYAHAEGLQTNAAGQASHSEGAYTQALGNGAHAEGHQTQAAGVYSHAEGESSNRAYTQVTSTATNETIINRWKSYKFSLAKGKGSHVEGGNNLALANYAHAEGEQTIASGVSSHAEGYKTTASANYSHAEGIYTQAQHSYSHAEGEGSLTGANYQHVQGKYNKTNANMAHIVGWGSSSARKNIHGISTGGSGYFKGDLYVNTDDALANGKKVATEEYVKNALDGKEIPTFNGGTLANSITFNVNGNQTTGLGVKWSPISSKNPYIGYATDQEDGTFALMSIEGTNYASGLAIGGTTGNLLWKGIQVATKTDVENYVKGKKHAGSASDGGPANSAVKLETATAGSATQPVYFSGGKPAACTYSLNATVPSNAKFTDTTYTFSTGDSNGQIKVTPLGGTAQNISVKGLGSAAYVDVNTTVGNYSGVPKTSAVWNAFSTMQDKVNNKVDKVSGKGLSTNDYTAAEKNKLAGIAANANNYSLPAASYLTRGGVRVTTQTSEVRAMNTATLVSGRSYPVCIHDTDRLFVNVPWTDTTYTASNGISLSGTTFSNSGVRSISTGTANGTISVNTNGTTTNVAVKGLGSAAYTSSSTYMPKSGGAFTGGITTKGINLTSGTDFYSSLPTSASNGRLFFMPDTTVPQTTTVDGHTWYYRTWENGIAECWSSITISLKSNDWTTNNAPGISLSLISIKASKLNTDLIYNLPITFSGRPTEIASINSHDSWRPVILESRDVDVTNSQTLRYNLITYQPESSMSITIHFHLMGYGTLKG